MRANVCYTYGLMKNTTIYLPDEMKERIEKVAKIEGKSEQRARDKRRGF